MFKFRLFALFRICDTVGPFIVGLYLSRTNLSNYFDLQQKRANLSTRTELTARASLL